MGTAGSVLPPPLPPPPPQAEARSRPCGLLYCRHRAALVSRRWHAAAHAPGLLREVLLFTAVPHAMAQLPSLTACCGTGGTGAAWTLHWQLTTALLR